MQACTQWICLGFLSPSCLPFLGRPKSYPCSCRGPFGELAIFEANELKKHIKGTNDLKATCGDSLIRFLAIKNSKCQDQIQTESLPSWNTETRSKKERELKELLTSELLSLTQHNLQLHQRIHVYLRTVALAAHQARHPSHKYLNSQLLD